MTPDASRELSPKSSRTVVVILGVALAFAAVAGQLIRLAALGQYETSIATARVAPSNFARPDIVDRHGRLMATDVTAPSLFADPAAVLDRDETVEKLAAILPDLDRAETRRALAAPGRRFLWLKRGLAPAVAQRVHDQGLPGLGFRGELRRVYPAGTSAGHVLGTVGVDNKGLSGVERYIDETLGAEPVFGAHSEQKNAVRLSIDLGVQHTLEDELRDAMGRYEATGAAGLVMDARTGEILASASIPEVDPARPEQATESARLDKVSGGAFELGSIFKVFTIAMALDMGVATLDTMVDAREPLELGRFTITDLHPSERPLSVAEIFLKSSNIGAGLLARAAGAERQRDFLGRLGLLHPMRTEEGPIPHPRTPTRWGDAETVTIAYGHGLAVAPVQVAAAAAAIVNGGYLVKPTLLRAAPGGHAIGASVLAPETSRQLRALMRRNVAEPSGTGSRADAPGFRVGGKTGTAEIASRGGYRKSAVIASFLGAFPMDDPAYVTLVILFEPKGVAETGGEAMAGLNAAPTTSRLVARIAPLLGVMPAFDPPSAAMAFDAHR